ncbi:MAG: hypothetical protein E7647_02780 [Ruminococcaceae bacterium]|nr:hypothetical protein [Oscillospiraceae bacterium]
MSEKIWDIENDHIAWSVKDGQCHFDDIEMSGLYTDLIVKYGICEDGTLFLSRHCFFPTLRTIPNNTHATYNVLFEESGLPCILTDGEKIKERPIKFTFDGILAVDCSADCGLLTKHQLFPSTDLGFCLEIVTLRAQKDVTLEPSSPRDTVYSYGRGTKGVYVAKVHHSFPDKITLKEGESFQYAIWLYCDVGLCDSVIPDFAAELEKRRERIASLCDGALVLKSSHPELDVLTRLSKLRAAESIFDTLGGKFHSPGGYSYYAAIWCNDQIEYSGPHFAMTGDETAIEAALNAYRAYMPFMASNYYRLPSSIIAEGYDIWEGAGDRGDGAMYLYGASLFCLLLGDEKVARELYPAIQWCAEYCEKNKTEDGVIYSHCDELEGRFPTDNRANLSTSSLCYGGLRLASRLALSLGDEDTAKLYTSRADELEEAIEAYFGACLHGFETYRYSKGFDTLRAWICLPLCMGIKTRAEGTLNAMLSPYLWTEEGMLTCEKSEENTSDTIWDRSTLYGMKCAYIMGKGDKMNDPLLRYCKKRLLCDRVPYAVEAYPEGGKRHLSGESALFVRIVSEGIFGIVPESLTSFSFDPGNCGGLSDVTLSKIHICGAVFDISVNNGSWQVYKNGELINSGIADGRRVIVE